MARLANDGVARQRVEALLAGQQDRGELPRWVATFRSIFLGSRVPAPRDEGDRAIDPDTPLPFEDLLIGAVRHARAEATARSPNLAAVLHPSAAAALEHELLARLTFVASNALGLEFYEFRFRRAPLSAFEDVFCEQPKTTDLYMAFVETMRRDGLLRLFDRYPVLARLIAQGLDQWVVNTAQLCDRFFADSADLGRLLDTDLQDPAGAIVDARSGLSDPHHGGATATALTLRSGQRVVYKPRSGGAELGWAAVLDWLNSRSPGCPLAAPAVLERGSHHWSTWVASHAASAEENVKEFYARAGATLAALHVLATTDIHCENLIASGDHPVVVDLELLLNPGSGSDFDAVDRTGMLPNWQTGPDGHRFDMSALGADRDQEPGIVIPAWRHVNTDQMRRENSAADGPSVDHRVRVSDEWPTALDHLDDLLQGFAAAYGCFLQGREELSADPEVQAALACIELRVLLRQTTSYARLLLHLLQPPLLRDGIERSIEIEWAARPLSALLPSPAPRLSIYEFERRALEAQDIPHLTVSELKALTAGSEDRDLLALVSGRTSETLGRRLEALSESDLDRQLAVIEEAVRQRFARRYPRQIQRSA